MPRPPRLDLPGAHHHVMNRGARHAPIFVSDDDCVAFLDLLALLRPRFGVEVHGYALMPNHFHLLLACPRAGLGLAMQLLQSRFSAHLNQRHGWDGPVFRGRYRNRLVEDEPYLAHLLAYLHLNPVRDGLVAAPEQARWTSCRAYLGLDGAPPWLQTDELLTLFGGREALSRYTWEVQVGRERGPASFDEQDLWSKAPSTAVPPPAVAGKAAPWPMAWEAAWQTLLAVTGEPRAALRSAPTGRRGGSPARDVAFWWLPFATGAPRAEVAREMGVDPAVASRAAQRALRRAREDAEVERWLEVLRGVVPGVGR